MLAALKAIQGNPEQDREIQEIEQNIQELKRQGYRLGRVLNRRQHKLCHFYRETEPD